jgi:hypothetical protein
MVSKEEARKLQQDSERELNVHPAAAICKCAAGLLILMLLVLIGSGSDFRHEARSELARAVAVEPAE